MKARYLTAAVGIPLVLGVVWLGGWAFFAVVAILALLAMWELDFACRRAGTPIITPVAHLVLAIILICAWKWAHAGDRSQIGVIWAWSLPIVLLLAGILAYTAPRKITLSAIALTQLAVFYVGLFAFLLLLRFFPAGGLHLFWIVLFGVWTSDTAAFLAGRKWGKRALTPLSPGKTREGFIAGVPATIVVCTGLALSFRFGFGDALMMGVLIALAAPLGDLIESFWKRELAVKDFGAILPGHGGVLDRCDSLLLSTFVLYLYALWQL